MDEYLIHYNHNHDKLGRFARSAGSASSSIGRKLSRKKDKNNTTRKYDSAKRLASKKTKASKVEVAKKKKGSKSNNTKLSDSERKRLVESGSAKEIIKNKDKLSNRELESAITRLQKEKTTRMDLEKKLSNLDKPSNDTKSFIDKMSSTGDKLNKAANAMNSGINAYNAAAKIHNAMNPNNKWTIVGEKSGDKTSEAMKKIIMTGSAAEVWANRSKMSSKEYTTATVRLGNDAKVKEFMNSETNNKTNNKTNNNSSKSTNYKSYFHEEQQNKTVDSWADARSHTQQTTQQKSTERANEILKEYPEIKTGESQKMTDEEIKKKYNRH